MIPIGVVMANRSMRVILRGDMDLLRLLLRGPLVFDAGRLEIRMPSERPSNSWWNVMAATRDAAMKWKENQVGVR